MRRRFIQSREPPYEFFEVSEDYESGPRTNTDGVLYNDRHYDGMRATDGADIGSRTKHREYMKLNGLTTVDDFKDTWKQSQARREAFYKGEKGSGAVTREHIERSIHQLTTSRRK